MSNVFPTQRAEQALPRLQVLNPNVSVKADTERVEDKPDDYFTQFDVICATCCTTDTLVRGLLLTRAVSRSVHTSKVFPSVAETG